MIMMNVMTMVMMRVVMINYHDGGGVNGNNVENNVGAFEQSILGHSTIESIIIH